MPPALPRIATRRSGRPSEGGNRQVRVPDAARQHRVLPPDRVNGNPFVQIEAAHAVDLGDVDELVAGLLLVDEPGLGPHGSGRNREQGRKDGGDEEPAAAEHGGACKRNDRGRDQQRPLGADNRNQDERGEERPEQAADRRERVEPAGDLARVPHVVDREPHRERGDHPEQDHRRREQHQDGEEGSDRRAGRDLVEALHRHVQKRSRRKRSYCDEGSSGEDDDAEQTPFGPSVDQSASEPVPERERRKHEPDHVGPNDRGAAVVGREQPRRGDLGRQRAGPRAEH